MKKQPKIYYYVTKKEYERMSKDLDGALKNTENILKIMKELKKEWQ